MQKRFWILIALSAGIISASGALALQSFATRTALAEATVSQVEGAASTSSPAEVRAAPFAQAAELATSSSEIPAPPLELIIPAIGLDSPIEDVGVTDDGAMAVPSGTTNDVGWYAAGTLPGTKGSAVLDAHVFAAFKNLNEVKVGDAIYVVTKDNQTLHFVVEETDTYPLADVPAQRLFNADDAVRLNLITCAGNLVPDHSTYDHRLVVYAVLQK